MAGPAEEGDALYRTGKVLHRQVWAVGGNGLLLMTGRPTRDVYPYFSGAEKGSFSPVIEIESSILGRDHLLRAYLPPGYYENTLKHYPVLFMQGGRNLFFPEEAFLGRDWIGERPEMAVAGSSLGGVVSFYLAWQWPQVFAAAACLSSTFSHRDNLIERVLSEPKNPAKFYLDSGWPGDNYEVTPAMALALQSRGYVPGVDFLQLAFPLHAHAETDWAQRLHLPLQLF
jgi:hypothetical protein